MAGSTKRPGLSLYGNLLGSDSSSSSNVISSAPVTYTPEQQAEIAKKKTDAPFGNFQPRISRPQQHQKTKVKQAGLAPAFSTPATTAKGLSHKLSSSTVTDGSGFTDPSPDRGAAKQPAGNFQRTTFDDFMTSEQYDDVDYDPRHKRSKGGRNKKRKKDNTGEVKHVWSWDDVYDPAFPNVYGDYKGSEEQAKANRDWKARLYHKKMKEAEKRRRVGEMSARDQAEPPSKRDNRTTSRSFAPPPPLLNFAPPTFEDQPSKEVHSLDEEDDDYDPYSQLGRADRSSSKAPPTFAPSFAPSSNRIDPSHTSINLSHFDSRAAEQLNVQPPLADVHPVPVHVRPQSSMTDAEKAAKVADAQVKIEALKKKFARQADDKPKPPSPARDHALTPPPANFQQVSDQPPQLSQASPAQQGPPSPPAAHFQPAEPEHAGSVISRAPIRYDVAAPPTDDGVTTAKQHERQAIEQSQEAPRTKKPGQKGFAQRILEKQGWQQGQGLGAQGQGITTAIFAQAQKRKKRSDAEGGGWVAPANMGRIVGGKKAKVDGAGSDEPQPSVVVKYTGLLAGLDAMVEISENDLYQSIGEAMNEKYGTVERIYVWLAGGNEVFIKFTDGMGALRATTNEFSFKGNTVVGQYFPEDKFEDGEYGPGSEASPA